MDSTKTYEADRSCESRYVVPQLADDVVRSCSKLLLGTACSHHCGFRLSRRHDLESHRALGLRPMCSIHHPRGQCYRRKLFLRHLIPEQEVQHDHRGLFSSTEASFQNAFELLSYVTTIIWSRPRQFRYPVLLSAVTVYTSGFLFGKYLRKRRGHLVHMPLWIKRKKSDD